MSSTTPVTPVVAPTTSFVDVLARFLHLPSVARMEQDAGVVAPRDCPCHSGKRYKACCEPLHARQHTAETPEALMRSRYAAFALGLGGYLVETLASDHPDRAEPDLERALSRVRERQRFLGLRILFAEGDEVLFAAKIFERGADRSFVELSTFIREDGHEEGEWRYASGITLPRSDVPDDVDRTAFLELTGKSAT
jgi:SEC-C motif-containing protein